MENEKLEKKLNGYIRDAVDFRSKQRDNEFIVNLAHYEGLHWNLAENKTDSPFLLRSDINHLKNAVDLRLGSLCAEKYWGELKPLSPYDVDAIEKLNLLYKNEWRRLNADAVVEYVVKYGAILGNCYCLINYDPDAIYGGTQTRREGAITLERLETQNIYLDPSASSLEECEYLVSKVRKSKRWVDKNKPKWKSKIEELNIKPGDNEDFVNQMFEGKDRRTGQENNYDFDFVYVKTIDDVDIEIEDERTNKKSKETVKRTIIKEHIMLDGHLIDTNENYPFDEFPVIGFTWERQPQSPYGIPLLRGLTVPQKVANLIESAANNIAMHYTVPTWLVSEESGIDIDAFAQLSNALGMVWKVSGDASRAVKQMDPPQINKDLIGIKDSFVNNIKTYAGISDTYVGNIGTAGSTAEGTLSAINRATIIDNNIIGQIESFVERLSRMIVKFMTRYYKNEEIYIRDTQTNVVTSDSFKKLIVEENYVNTNYEFDVNLASRSKSDKNRQYNLMKELYTLQNQYKEDKKVINVPDLVKAAQLDNYNEMFKRFSDMSEEAFMEKADLIVQILSIGQTITPNGTPLITAEEMQQGIIDVLDDNGTLQTVEQIFKTYETYQTEITELKNAMIANEQQNEINAIRQQEQDLQQRMNQTKKDMTFRDNTSNVNQSLTDIGL